MRKPYTEDDFIFVVTEDFGWRIREISDFRLAIQEAAQRLKNSLFRSGVPLLYAHWEGHLRFCTFKYLEYLSFKRKTYAELQDSILCVYTRSYFDALTSRRLTFSERLTILRELVQKREARFVRASVDDVETRSNLNSAVLSELCMISGVNVDHFRDEFDFIDKILLSRRNNIAHGQEIYITEADFREMSDRTISIMRQYRDSIENNVILGAYQN